MHSKTIGSICFSGKKQLRNSNKARLAPTNKKCCSRTIIIFQSEKEGPRNSAVVSKDQHVARIVLAKTGPTFLRFSQRAEDHGLLVGPLYNKNTKSQNSGSEKSRYEIPLVLTDAKLSPRTFPEDTACPSIHGFKTTLPGIRVMKD